MRESPPRSSSRLRHALVVGLAIGVTALVAYSNSFHGVFVLDDHPTLEHNASLRNLWSSQVLFPPPEVGTAGRPFANLTFALNYAAGGLNLWGYHAVNLALHITTAIFIAGLLRRLLVQPALAPRYARHANTLAAVSALLWVAHPLTTETVTYVSQRTEALAACAMVVTLYAFLRFAAGSAVWGVVGVVTCALGMASKETAVVVPLLVLVIDVAVISGTWREAWRRHWRWYLAAGCCWLMLAWLMATADLARRGIGFGQMVGSLDYLRVESRAVLTYLKLSLWPHPLVFDYGWLESATASNTLAFVGVSLAVVGVVLAWWRGRLAAVAAIIWLLMLAPTSSVVPIAEQPIAENRAYLPLAVVITGLVLGAYRLLNMRVVPIAAAAVVALVAATFHRNALYASEATLWRDALAYNPRNARALNTLGMLALNAGDIEHATTLHRRALAIRPRYAEAEANLGSDLLMSGRPAEAIPHFRTALALEPALKEVHANLGNALLATGELDAALAEFERTVQLMPDAPEAHYNLARALANKGASARAVAEFGTALQLHPGFVEARLDLGNLLLRSGDLAGAAAAYKAVLQQRPDMAAAHNNLGFVLVQMGRCAEAIDECEAALRLQPNYAAAHANDANALLQLHRLDAAMEHYRAAIALDPNNEETRDGLGVALALNGEGDAAREQFRAALRVNPRYEPARRHLEQLGP